MFGPKEELAENHCGAHQGGANKGQPRGFGEGFKKRLQSIHDTEGGCSRITRRAVAQASDSTGLMHKREWGCARMVEVECQM